MKTKSQNTFHIVRHLGKQGTHPPEESSKSGVGKCTTVLATSLEKYCHGNQAQGDLQVGPSRVTPTKKMEKDKRQKWSMEDYKEVMYAFHMSLEKPTGSHTENTFRIGRS